MGKICRNCKTGKSKKHPTSNINKNAPDCPKCDSKMIMKHRKRDDSLFWGCTKFPECNGTIEVAKRQERFKFESRK